MESRLNVITFFVLIFLVNIIYSASEVNTGQFGHRWRCDYTYVKKANGYFKFHEIPANWHDARLRCQLEGAELASPYPDEVQDALQELMIHHKRNRTIFIGIHATFSKGDYYTVNGVYHAKIFPGTPLSKIPIQWMESEPDNKDDAEDCLIFSLTTGLAADTKCSDTYPYFCYKEKKDDDLFRDYCGTSDGAYEYSEQTHSCYKFHTVPRKWSRAHMACSAEGGHLVIINNKDEAEFIKNLYAKYPDRTMIGNFRKDLVFIGVRDWNEQADWRTIQGETLKEAGYDMFGAGEPNNNTGQYCGGAFRTGLMADLWCEQYFPFICEKNPATLVCDDRNCTALADVE